MSSYLEVNNVSKSYGPRVLFDRISFHIDEGDKIALVAPNGTGKTSLLSIIAGGILPTGMAPCISSRISGLHFWSRTSIMTLTAPSRI